MPMMPMDAMGGGGFSGLMKAGAGGGGGLSKMFGGLNPGQAIGGSIGGMGKGLMSGGFEKAYTGSEHGGYEALMKGAKLDGLREGKVIDGNILDKAMEQVQRSRARQMEPTSGNATGMGPNMGGQ